MSATSPINVNLPIAVTGNLDLQIHWLGIQSGSHQYDANAIKITFDRNDNSYIMLDGEKYWLNSIHFHRPGEHTFNGLPASTELHVVHSDSTGAPKVVIAIYFDIVTSTGTDISQTLEEVLFLTYAAFLKIAVEKTDPNMKGYPTPLSFLPGDKSTVLRYDGSLTTAPYTQGIKWLLFDKQMNTINVSLPLLNVIFPNEGQGSAHATQPLGDRTVSNLNWSRNSA